MTDENDDASQFVVNPTGQRFSDNYSDITITSLFNAHVTIINSERQAIWQRYSALLIANSVVLSFLGTKSPSSLGATVVGSVIGILLCCAWWLLTADGWKFFTRYSESAAKFSWPKIGESTNPISTMFTEFDKQRGDRIKHVALSVIGIFFVSYAIIAAWAILNVPVTPGL